VLCGPDIDAHSIRMDEGHGLKHRLGFLAFLAMGSSRQGAQGERKDRQRGILERIQAWEERCSAARLFHLEKINASRWRNANKALERSAAKNAAPLSLRR
jgi:hypothetical protein